MSFDFTETLTITVPDVEDQIAAFQENEYKKTHGLIIEVAAIHEGMTANYNFYPAKALEESLSSWVTPYPKPIIMNHDPTSEPVGRVMAAKMEKEDDGTPYVMLRVAITDPEAISKVSDQRYLTGSVGGSAKKANCSVCGADWAEASIRNIPCKHQRGKTYKGKLAYMEMNEIGFKEYSFVNMPADQHSGVRALHIESELEGTDDWVKAAKVYSLNMDDEEILEFSESQEVSNILEEKSKKEASWMYAQFKGSFLSALIAESDSSNEDSKKPYGDVKYADPGYQSDGVKRYPIDTKDHVRAAWSYINQRKNASKYTSDQLKKIKGRIRAAAKRFGIELGDEEFDVTTDIINEEEEDILAVAEGLSSDLAEPEAEEEETASTEEGEEEEEESVEEEEEETVATDEDNSAEEAEEEEEEISEEATASEEEEPAEEAEKPEGQESPRDKDIDPEDSKGAPVSREDDDDGEEDVVVTAEEGEQEEEEVSEEEEESETDLNESIATLESRVEELETREQTLLEENAKLKAALKRNLAERVVDMKVALGFVKPDAREEELEEHAKRSASSLADSLRDLAGMSRSSDIQLPQVNNESASIDEDDNSFIVNDDVDDPEEKEDELDPEDVFVDALMGRRKL